MRRSLEQKAGPVLVLVAQAPRWVPFLVVLGCVVGGLIAHGVVSAVLLGLVLVLLALQLFFAWPVLQPPQRLLRVAVLGLITAVIISRF